MWDFAETCQLSRLLVSDLRNFVAVETFWKVLIEVLDKLSTSFQQFFNTTLLEVLIEFC
jgi:hypothetical protein